jgi:hypothetical protein
LRISCAAARCRGLGRLTPPPAAGRTTELP